MIEYQIVIISNQILMRLVAKLSWLTHGLAFVVHTRHERWLGSLISWKINRMQTRDTYHSLSLICLLLDLTPDHSFAKRIEA